MQKSFHSNSFRHKIDLIMDDKIKAGSFRQILVQKANFVDDSEFRKLILKYFQEIYVNDILKAGKQRIQERTPQISKNRTQKSVEKEDQIQTVQDLCPREEKVKLQDEQLLKAQQTRKQEKDRLIQSQWQQFQAIQKQFSISDQQKQEIKQLCRKSIDMKQFQQQILQILGSSTAKKIKKVLLDRKLFMQQKDPRLRLAQKLKKHKGQKQMIQQILKLFDKGKKTYFKNIILFNYGIILGNKILEQFLKFIPQKNTYPISNSQLLAQTNKDFEILRYPLLSQIKNKQYRGQLKKIILLGQSGSGKSALINNFVNFIAGVELDDKLRYKIVIEKKRGVQSSTRQVKDYQVSIARQKLDFNLKIIDTPGFFNRRDQQITHQIIQFINNQIDQIHALIIVVKSTISKASQELDQILRIVCRIFGHQILKNIVFVFTFADAGQNLGIYSIVNNFQSRYEVTLQKDSIIKINNSVIFNQIIVQSQSQIIAMWEQANRNLGSLYRKIVKAESIWLNNRISQFKLKKQLNFRYNNLNEQIDKLVIKLNQYQQIQKASKPSCQIKHKSQIYIQKGKRKPQKLILLTSIYDIIVKITSILIQIEKYSQKINKQSDKDTTHILKYAQIYKHQPNKLKLLHLLQELARNKKQNKNVNKREILKIFDSFFQKKDEKTVIELKQLLESI